MQRQTLPEYAALKEIVQIEEYLNQIHLMLLEALKNKPILQKIYLHLYQQHLVVLVHAEQDVVDLEKAYQQLEKNIKNGVLHLAAQQPYPTATGKEDEETLLHILCVHRGLVGCKNLLRGDDVVHAIKKAKENNPREDIKRCKHHKRSVVDALKKFRLFDVVVFESHEIPERKKEYVEQLKAIIDPKFTERKAKLLRYRGELHKQLTQRKASALIKQLGMVANTIKLEKREPSPKLPRYPIYLTDCTGTDVFNAYQTSLSDAQNAFGLALSHLESAKQAIKHQNEVVDVCALQQAAGEKFRKFKEELHPSLVYLEETCKKSYQNNQNLFTKTLTGLTPKSLSVEKMPKYQQQFKLLHDNLNTYAYAVAAVITKAMVSIEKDYKFYSSEQTQLKVEIQLQALEKELGEAIKGLGDMQDSFKTRAARELKAVWMSAQNEMKQNEKKYHEELDRLLKLIDNMKPKRSKIGKVITGVFGGIAGAFAGGVAGAMVGGGSGAFFMGVGVLPGAIIGALFGAITGGAAGAVLAGGLGHLLIDRCLEPTLVEMDTELGIVEEWTAKLQGSENELEEDGQFGELPEITVVHASTPPSPPPERESEFADGELPPFFQSTHPPREAKLDRRQSWSSPIRQPLQPTQDGKKTRPVSALISYFRPSPNKQVTKLRNKSGFEAVEDHFSPSFSRSKQEV